jgi:hypothetical protein
LLAAFVVLFTVMVVGIRFVNTDPVLIDPDLYQQRNELRSNTDLNGYEDLVAALNLLPNKPPIDTRSNHDNSSIYIPLPNTVANRLKIPRHDDDPVLLQFLDDCEPAFDQVIVALQKPVLLFPYQPIVEWQFLQTYHKVDFRPLVTTMASAAQSKILLQNEADEGFELLARLYALHRRMTPEIETSVGMLCGEILDTSKDIAVALESSEDMRTMLTMLLTMEPVYAMPEDILDRWHNVIDNMIMFPQSGNMQEGAMDFGMRTTLWQIQRVAKFLAKDENDMSLLARAPDEAYLQWVRDRKLQGFNFLNSVERYTISSILSGLLWARVFAARYVANEVLLAAKLYHTAHGRYPPNLDSLVPIYLPAVPQNPITGQPFVYELQGDYFILASEGATTVDFWGEIREPRRHYYIEPKDFLREGAEATSDQAK